MKNFRSHLRMDKIQEFPSNLICEGLILSWTYEELESQLRKILNKLNSKYTINVDDFKLSLKLDKLISIDFYDKLLKLLHIAGYYTSNFYIQNNIGEITKYNGYPSKAEFFSPYIQIQFDINKKYDTKELGIPLKMYHVTELQYLEIIEKKGKYVSAHTVST